MKKKLIQMITVASLVSMPLFCSAGDGAELWMKNCKKCHGAEGKGDTPMGKKFEVRDYTDASVQASLTDEAVKDAIVNGFKNEDGKKVMLAFGSKLSDEDVDALVAHLRSLQAE